MAYIPPETIEKARQVDLLTYMKACEPDELVHISGNHYCTREHDSLKISNGKWYWFSRGFGGYNALDYLIKVKEVPFMEAVERITGQVPYQSPAVSHKSKQKQPKVLLLPKVSPCATHAFNYLRSRGINEEIIHFCFQTGRVYESLPHHNVVFVGLDKYNTPGMPISEESTQISLEKQTAATSVSPSVSRLRTVRQCICLRVLSICYPMPHWSSKMVAIGRRIIWCPWQVYSSPRRVCRKALCR